MHKKRPVFGAFLSGSDGTRPREGHRIESRPWRRGLPSGAGAPAGRASAVPAYDHPVRHAILGAGGVGGLVGGALARAGANVVLVLRPSTLARHPRRLRVESVALGDFEVDVATASVLDRDVDVLWVTPKATQLEAALELAPRALVGDAVVVPLLNGVDHVALLRARYEHVLAAAIYVESERHEPGLVRQPTPLALTTTAFGVSVGVVQAEPAWNARLVRCHDEAVAVALAEGAKVAASRLRGALLGFSGGEMRTSMQKDFAAGRPLELDAIAGPVVLGGWRHRIATPATEELVRLIEARRASML